MQYKRFNAVRPAAAAVGLLCFAAAASGQCPGGEAPADYCTSARVLSGLPGTQIIQVDTSNATAAGETACGVPIGHTVWFSMVPTASGVLTFSTCHPVTTYDTVAEAFSGGDSGCEFMVPVQCNDDTAAAECNNGCSAWGSRLVFDVTAGTQYRFRVGSYNSNSAHCNLCLGVVVSLCSGDATPPEVNITTPGVLACICPSTVRVEGSVSDPGSGVSQFVVDYAPVASPTWTLIFRGFGNTSGLLGLWYASGLGEGDYYVRVTARDGCNNVNSVVRTVHVDAALDSFQLRSPVSGSVLGGVVYADGTVWDHCAPGQLQVTWSPALLPVLIPFDSVNPPWVVNDPLGWWDTKDTADGAYQVRAAGITQCGASVGTYVNVTVDNTRPTVVITSPPSCVRFMPGVLQIRGTVTDANLASWVLQYTGGDSHGWVTISSGSAPVINGLLGMWDTRGLRWCQYALRLVATDTAVLDGNGALHNQSEYTTTFDMGCLADFNSSGMVSVQDIFDFLAAYFGGC